METTWRMGRTTEKKRSERRKGPDALTKSIRWLGVAGWSIMSIILFLIDRAKPDFAPWLDTRRGVKVRKYWDQDILSNLDFLIIACLCVTLLGIYLNAKRNRRKADSFRINLIILSVMSIFGIFYYSLRF